MRWVLILFSAVCLFSTGLTGLRDIKVGDRLPDKEELKVFKPGENKLILFINSGISKNLDFFKQLTPVIDDPESPRLYLVDAGSEFEPGFKGLFESLKCRKQYVNDNQRKIYGGLGIIVQPTLLFVTGDNVLHSVIAGNRGNLPLFLKANLEALMKGVRPKDVGQAVKDKEKAGELQKKMDQAFRLMAGGDFELAHKIYMKVIEIEPGNKDAQLGVGYALLFMEKIDESRAYFSTLKERSESKDKRVLLGYYLCTSMTEPTTETLEQIARLSRLEPRLFFVVYFAGGILDKAGKCSESKDVYRHSYKVLSRYFRRNK